MLKKTVTYTDPFEEKEVTEDLYFNLTKAEIAELALTEGGDDYAESLRSLSGTNDAKTIMAEFKKLLGLAYGKREGNKHIKSPEITREFLSSEAYSELFMELIMQPDSGASFFQGLLPKDLESIKTQLDVKADPNDKRPAWVREDREPTQAELTSMTKAQMVEVMQRRASKA